MTLTVVIQLRFKNPFVSDAELAKEFSAIKKN